MEITSQEIYARLYDLSVPDWPGELDFYLELTTQVQARKQEILEVACGTGRVCLRLAQAGLRTTGVDISKPMLEIARQKGQNLANIRWVEGDMRRFDLDQKFGLVIVPGHSFQFMLTPEDQLVCLENLKRHLERDGFLVIHLDHQDLSWLGDLLIHKGGEFEDQGILKDPQSGARIRTWRSWSYQRATQTARAVVVREQLNDLDQIVYTWETSTDLHCVFRFEMAHLLRLAGFEINALYGDFFKHELAEDSNEMVWVARPSAGL